MATKLTSLPLVVIVGPTASGKTAAAISIARRYNGEVIAADSRTVYRGMDIGTAKPSEEEQAGVVHWGFDLTEPGQRFSAAQFQAYAIEKIADIRSRGRLPIVVGGTGLYVDGLLFDYQFPERPTDDIRHKLESMSLDELYKYCVDNNIELPINDKNKRHLVRRIAHAGVDDKRRGRIIDNTIVVGIATSMNVLEQRFVSRAEHMFATGVVKEATMLGEKYGWNSEAMTGNIYPLIREHLNGHATLEDTISAFVVRDRRLAKRQMTWFRRNPWIVWSTANGVESFLTQALDERAQL